jgi:hypothetical protein
MKVITQDIALPGNAFHTVGEPIPGNDLEHPTMEAALEFINDRNRAYFEAGAFFITSIKTVVDDAREQFSSDARKAMVAFGNALYHDNNVNVRKINGQWTYTDTYRNNNITAEVKVTASGRNYER